MVKYSYNVKKVLYPMSKERKKILFLIILTDALALLTAILFALFFSPTKAATGESLAKCRFQELFSLYCPGCGGTRAVGHLFLFDFISSFKCYPPLYVGIGLLIWINALFIYSFKNGSLEYIKKRRYFEFLLIPASILLLFFVRNALLLLGIDTLGDILK